MASVDDLISTMLALKNEPMIGSRMHTALSHVGRLLGMFMIAVSLASIQPVGFGQLNSRAASISLVARLESLSIVAAIPDNVGFPDRAQSGLHQIPVLLTTSWVVPSNRTTVRVVEDGKSLFSQASGDSNKPETRIDQLSFTLPCVRPEVANPETKQQRLVIWVQAL